MQNATARPDDAAPAPVGVQAAALQVQLAARDRRARRAARRAARRPPWVWLIASYYVSAGLWSLAIYYQLLNGQLTLLPPSRRMYFEGYGSMDYLLLMSFSLLGVIAGLLFVQLRKESVYLFALKFAGAAGVTIWYGLTRGALDASSPGNLLAALVLWSVSAVVCYYAWLLQQRGVLK